MSLIDYTQNNIKGNELQDKLFSLSKEILNTAPEYDKMVEFFMYCSQQATNQIQHIVSSESMSFKEQLVGIKEWSINLANFSLAMTALSVELEQEVKEGSRFSTGYGNWLTPYEFIRKQLNESCNTYFSRAKNKLSVIDNLKLLYVDIYNIKFQDTDTSILSDEKILESVKLFFRNQCYLNFILCHEIIFEQCKQYSQDLKNAPNN